MMKRLKIKDAIIGSILVILILFMVWDKYTAPKYAYIDIKAVYDGFELKKELQKNYSQVIDARQKKMDSLALRIKIYERKLLTNGQILNDATYNAMVTEYYEMKKSFTEDNDALAQKMDIQIIDQINEDVKEYGKNNNYSFIFGASGNGTFMYAKESMNVTKPVLEYINNKHKGEKQ